MISTSSVISALVFYSVILLGVCLMRRLTILLEKSGVFILLLGSAAAVARLFLPVEIPFSREIRSWNLLGAAQRFLREHPAVERTLLIIWGVGAVIVVAWDVFLFCLARRRCRSYTIVDSELVRQVAGRVGVGCPVLVTPDVEVPCAAGIFRHTIYLPQVELSEQEIELILAHEVQHIRSHDAKIKLFVGLLTAVMWWNPIAQLFRAEIGRILELRCDANVVRHMDKTGRDDYLQMLKHMASRIAFKGRVPALALDESQAVGRKQTFIEQRFEVILADEGKRPRSAGAAAIFLLAVMFCASYLVIFQPAELAPAENFQNDLRTVYEEEYEGPENYVGVYDSFIIKGSDGRYQLFTDYKFSRYLSEEQLALDEYKDLFRFQEDRQK